MRIVFIGAVEFSRRTLQHLIGMGAEVVGVCTLASSPSNSDHQDLSGLAVQHGIPWIHAPQVNEPATIEWIAARRPDVVFCFGWSRLLGPALLQVAPMGVVGFHPALLPANRGRHPIIWALALGLSETGSTFFFMDEGADSGDILSQEHIAISADDTSASLYERITTCALRQIEAFVPQLQSGRYVRRPQDHRLANTWRKRGRADGQIDWRMSAAGIHNLVRALTRPYPGAHFLYRGAEVKVWSTSVVRGVPANVEPGKVLGVGTEGALVRCGDNAIRLLRTEPEFTPMAGEYL